jgi:hypothetical protein
VKDAETILFSYLVCSQIGKIASFMDDCHFSYTMKFLKKTLLLASITKKAPKNVEKPFVYCQKM